MAAQVAPSFQYGTRSSTMKSSNTPSCFAIGTNIPIVIRVMRASG
ncbi:MAG: hypothetical protein ACLSIQ_00535 [Akkermansia sp.]